MKILIICVFLTLIGVSTCYQCTLTPKRVNPNANVGFSVILSLTTTDQGVCQSDRYSEGYLKALTAVEWVVKRLNGLNNSTPFIDGVTFGFDVYNDCGQTSYAVRSAMEVMNSEFDPGLVSCTNGNSEPWVHLGILGPTTSSAVIGVAEQLRGTSIPLLTPSATLPSLSNKTLYPNVVRTVPPDSYEVKAMVAIFKELKWNYIAAVHTTDTYGRSGIEALKKEAKKYNICISPVFEIVPPISDTARTISGKLADHLATMDNSLGVVYFGHRDAIDKIFRWITSKNNYHWMFSDGVANMPADENVYGAIRLTPSMVNLQSFEEYNVAKWADVVAQKINNPVDQMIQKFQTTNSQTTPTQKSDFISAYVDAVYSFAAAFKSERNSVCAASQDVICTELKNSANSHFLNALLASHVDYGNATIGQSVYPDELIRAQKSVSFDNNGDVQRNGSDKLYDVTSLVDPDTIKVGYYTKAGVTLDKASIKMKIGERDVSGGELPISQCLGMCMECIEDTKVRFVYKPGDAIILGIFSLHELKSIDSFHCGNFRNVSEDTITVQAFLHSIDEINTKTGLSFGGLALDDCYSGLRANYIVSNLFSGDIKLKIPGSDDQFIDVNKIVAVVGAMSSGVTIPLAETFTRLKLPQVSYASTSPDLDDRISYPYFNRVVPSDVHQARAMVEILKLYEWEYVSIVYVDNNYGSEGMTSFRKIASENGICVADPIKLFASATDIGHFAEIINQLERQEAKVVIYFGTDTKLTQLFSVLKDKYANEPPDFIFIGSEDWGTNEHLLTAGGRAIRGSFTLSIDITKTTDNTFENYVITKKYDKSSDHNSWFERFWQSYFKCDPVGGFTNIYGTKCLDNLKITPTHASKFTSNQRVVHTINAVHAVGEGIKQAQQEICNFADFPCVQFKMYPEILTSKIREVQLMESGLPFKVFDAAGNGNIGFKIWNIQQKAADVFEYKEVGSYRDGDVYVDKDNVVFYTKFGKQLPDKKTSPCTGTLCDKCERTQTTVAPEVTGPTSANTGGAGDSDAVRWSDVLIILIFVILLVIVVLVVAFFCCCDKGASAQTKEKPSEIYSPVGYGNGEAGIGHGQPRRLEMMHAVSTSDIMRPNSSRGQMNGGFVGSDYLTVTNAERSQEDYDDPDKFSAGSVQMRQQPKTTRSVTYSTLSGTVDGTDAPALPDRPQQQYLTNATQPRSQQDSPYSNAATASSQSIQNSAPRSASEYSLNMSSNPSSPSGSNPFAAVHPNHQPPFAQFTAAQPVSPQIRPFNETVLYDSVGRPFVVRANSVPQPVDIQPLHVFPSLSPQDSSLESIQPIFQAAGHNSPQIVNAGQLQTTAQSGSQPTTQGSPNPAVGHQSAQPQVIPGSQSPRIKMGVNGSQPSVTSRPSPTIPNKHSQRKVEVERNVLNESQSSTDESRDLSNEDNTGVPDKSHIASEVAEEMSSLASKVTDIDLESKKTPNVTPRGKHNAKSPKRNKPRVPPRQNSSLSEQDVKLIRKSSSKRSIIEDDDEKVTVSRV